MSQSGRSIQISQSRSHQLVRSETSTVATLNSIALVTRYHRGQMICDQDGPDECWYRVASGVGRRCVLRRDGRRQIVDLLLPGDFFGVINEAGCCAVVEAVTDGTAVARYPYHRVEQLADSNPDVGREIRKLAFETIARLQGQLLILGRITAVEKVGAFLLKMAERLSDQPGDRLVLPMSRYDIADYLAVSVETVSRALTCLKHRGVITFAGTRRVRIVDRGALQDRAWGGGHDGTMGHISAASSRAVRPVPPRGNVNSHSMSA
jgi:CRP/FNR family transcriptional regulator, nitrogen fixation regulation protein